MIATAAKERGGKRSVRTGVGADLHGYNNNNTRGFGGVGRWTASHSPDCAEPESKNRHVRMNPRQRRLRKAAEAAAADVVGFMIRRLASYPLCKIHMSGSGSVSLLGTVKGR